jgi:hypothetical protein
VLKARGAKVVNCLPVLRTVNQKAFVVHPEGWWVVYAGQCHLERVNDHSNHFWDLGSISAQFHPIHWPIWLLEEDTDSLLHLQASIQTFLHLESCKLRCFQSTLLTGHENLHAQFLQLRPNFLVSVEDSELCIPHLLDPML